MRGDLAPLTLRLTCDLRLLVKAGLDWDDILDTTARKRWMENFSLLEDVREIMYVRCKIPSDAVSKKCRVWMRLNLE